LEKDKMACECKAKHEVVSTKEVAAYEEQRELWNLGTTQAGGTTEVGQILA
jgi:hypothetical protein